MKYKYLLFLLALFFIGCTPRDRVNVVIYPNYCGGAVIRNFHAIAQSGELEKFNIYFDSTDLFVLEESRLAGLHFIHIDKKDIPLQFGDYANIVVENLEGDIFELKTNEIIQKGKYY